MRRIKARCAVFVTVWEVKQQQTNGMMGGGEEVADSMRV